MPSLYDRKCGHIREASAIRKCSELMKLLRSGNGGSSKIPFKIVLIFLKIPLAFPCRQIRPVGQAVKTPPSHGGNRGSIPLPAILKTSDMIRGFFVSKNPDPVPKKSRIFTELMFTTQDLFASSHAESPRLAQDLDESGKSPVSLCHHEKREVPCFPVISPKREDSCSGRSIFFADLSFVRTDTLSPFQSNISGIAAGAQTGRARISRSVRLMCTRRSA